MAYSAQVCHQGNNDNRTIRDLLALALLPLKNSPKLFKGSAANPDCRQTVVVTAHHSRSEFVGKKHDDGGVVDAVGAGREAAGRTLPAPVSAGNSRALNNARNIQAGFGQDEITTTKTMIRVKVGVARHSEVFSSSKVTFGASAADKIALVVGILGRNK